jgi:hypothetical protein
LEKVAVFKRHVIDGAYILSNKGNDGAETDGAPAHPDRIQNPNGMNKLNIKQIKIVNR